MSQGTNPMGKIEAPTQEPLLKKKKLKSGKNTNFVKTTAFAKKQFN